MPLACTPRRPGAVRIILNHPVRQIAREFQDGRNQLANRNGSRQRKFVGGGIERVPQLFENVAMPLGQQFLLPHRVGHLVLARPERFQFRGENPSSFPAPDRGRSRPGRSQITENQQRRDGSAEQDCGPGADHGLCRALGHQNGGVIIKRAAAVQ